MQRKPDLGDRCKLRAGIPLLIWSVQRKPDLGDRCKRSPAIQAHRSGDEVQRKPDLGDRCKYGMATCLHIRKVQRKPDLGDRCKMRIASTDCGLVGCNGNLTWAIVASLLAKTCWAMGTIEVQRKPDLGDRCKLSKKSRSRNHPQVQRKPDLGDRCKDQYRMGFAHRL